MKFLKPLMTSQICQNVEELHVNYLHGVGNPNHFGIEIGADYTDALQEGNTHNFIFKFYR